MGDNCCNCEYTAIVNGSPMDPDDFIYGNYENKVTLSLVPVWDFLQMGCKDAEAHT